MQLSCTLNNTAHCNQNQHQGCAQFAVVKWKTYLFTIYIYECLFQRGGIEKKLFRLLIKNLFARIYFRFCFLCWSFLVCLRKGAAGAMFSFLCLGTSIRTETVKITACKLCLIHNLLIFANMYSFTGYKSSTSRLHKPTDI